MASRSRLLRDERGIVFIELLVAIVPLWTLALSAFQLSLIAAANLVTKHAADSAARSASVVLTDDPSEYGGEPQGSVDRSAGALAYQGRSRLETIRLAAIVPLLPFSSRGALRASRPNLERAIPAPLTLGAALVRGSSGIDVTFVGVEEGRVSGPELTVRVSHAFECVVPIARRLLCESLDTLARSDGLPHRALRVTHELDGDRYRLLIHQATLLIHDAPYEYRPRGS